MNVIENIKQAFNLYLKEALTIDQTLTDKCSLTLNADEKKSSFGDLNSNAAMVLGKELKKDPKQIAEIISGGFTHEMVDSIGIAGPGFLNFHLNSAAFTTLMKDMIDTGDTFFKLPNEAPKFNVTIEFVSANPTGPLHFGHGRGGIIGDVLANVMNFIGHKADREFYINDAGSQIQKLGMSFKIRCQQAAGLDVQLPEDAYHGDYLEAMAQELIKAKGKAILEQPDSYFAQYAKEKMLEQLKATLEFYGINFDIWFSEKTLHDSGAIEKALAILQERGYLYEKEGATWFKSTEFGDDKDRVVKKADGSLTYVAADIAYLRDKISRDYNHLIMILGHDHHSYVVRLHAVQQALGLGQYPFDIILYQLVKMKSSGELVRMSKRAGNIVTLQDVIETVGKDVARFFFLNRKADAQLEFDVDLALKKTEENPVYYVQYAYVRTKSILEKAAQDGSYDNLNNDDLVHLGEPEKMLIKKIVSLKEVLETIGQNHQTHTLTYYVLELANIFHSYYGANRVMDPDHKEQSRARLLLITQLKNTFALALQLLGISLPERM